MSIVGDQVKEWVFQGKSHREIQVLARREFGCLMEPKFLSKLTKQYNQARTNFVSGLLAEGVSQEEAKRQCRAKFGRGMGDAMIKEIMREFLPDTPPIEKVALPPEVLGEGPPEAAQEPKLQDLHRPNEAFLQVLAWLKKTNNRSATITDTGKVLVQRQIDITLDPESPGPSLLEILRTLPRRET